MFVWLRSLFRASSPRRVRRPGPATRLTREPGSAARRPVQPVDLVGLATTYPPELHRPADPAAFGDRCESVARAVRAQREQVPPFPAVATRVAGLLRQPDVDVNEVVAALQQDPSLAAQVLSVANSGLFAGHGEVASVRDAVLRLGLREIHLVVTTAAMLALLDAGNRATGDRFAAEWSRLTRHAVSAGFGAAWLALEGDSTQYETALMAGLLHDAGRVMALRAVAAVVPPEASGPYGTEHFLASLVEGVHLECAALAFEQWHLPDAVRQVCLHHHAEADTLLGLPKAVHYVRIASALDDLRTNPHPAADASNVLLESLRALDVDASAFAPMAAELARLAQSAARVVTGASVPARRSPVVYPRAA